ncbi:MAG: PAS domain-containing sensor histidine kinase [Pseudomonadota bacterium]
MALSGSTSDSTLDRSSFTGSSVIRRAWWQKSTTIAVGLAITGPILATLTYATISSNQEGELSSIWFKALILADICYLVVLASLIGLQIARLIVARRARSAGSRLHARMVAFFTGVAAAPAILVAVFFFLVIQLGFEAWFSDRVSSIVRNSHEVARAYSAEHREAIGGEAIALAKSIDAAAGGMPISPEDVRFREFLDRTTEATNFSDVYILNSSGEIVARGADSFLFTFTPPSLRDLDLAASGELVIREDRLADEMRALLKLDSVFDAYLYVTRPVDGAVLTLLEKTDSGVKLYTRLEQNREAWLAQFAALYIGFAVLVLMAAIYLGLWFAERLSRPIGRLSAAAQRVRSGDLDVRVKEERGDDDLSLLSRVFNRMTEEVKRKQDELSEAHMESEQRRLFSEAVLSGVSAGVVGLDQERLVMLLNAPAARLIGVDEDDAVGRSIEELVPEFSEILDSPTIVTDGAVEKQIKIIRKGQERDLLVRVTVETSGDDSTTGLVVTIDDMTALVSAQRMAAWGDVARRIAHEIKNPLTPIQLAAERLRRKYGERLGEDAETFDRYTDTIVRHTGDIGRMVDAFVRFAKMPSPEMATVDLRDVVREAVVLQKEARAHIDYSTRHPEDPVLVRADRGQVLQAAVNLMLNAADAIKTRLDKETEEGVEGAAPEIRVALEQSDRRNVLLTVQDNGIGLPATDRMKLLEPYVTTRKEGTGLGLAIVMKIVEEHGGELLLFDADPFSEGAQPGACAAIRFPLVQQTSTKKQVAAEGA